MKKQSRVPRKTAKSFPLIDNIGMSFRFGNAQTFYHYPLQSQSHPYHALFMDRELNRGADHRSISNSNISDRISFIANLLIAAE